MTWLAGSLFLSLRLRKLVTTHGDGLLWTTCWLEAGVLEGAADVAAPLPSTLRPQQSMGSSAESPGLRLIPVWSFARNWSILFSLPVQGFSLWVDCRLLPRHRPILRLSEWRPTEPSIRHTNTRQTTDVPHWKHTLPYASCGQHTSLVSGRHKGRGLWTAFRGTLAMHCIILYLKKIVLSCAYITYFLKEQL